MFKLRILNSNCILHFLTLRRVLDMYISTHLVLHSLQGRRSQKFPKEEAEGAKLDAGLMHSSIKIAVILSRNTVFVLLTS